MTTTQALPEGKLLLDGQWVSATKGATIPVVDPATQEVIQTIARGTKEDVDQAVDFYTNVLGLTLAMRMERQGEFIDQVLGFQGAHIKGAFLNLGEGHQLELIQYLNPTSGPGGINRNDLGAAHLAFYVEDAKATWQRLVDMGGKAVNPPIELLPGVWLCYMQDPDGNWIEITSDVEHDRLQFIIRHNMITQ